MNILNYINLSLFTKQWVKMTLIFAAFLITTTQTTYAATDTNSQIFNVSPAIINVPLSPGKKYSYKVTVTNLSNRPLPLQASLNDFQTTGEEGDYLFADTKTNPLLSWINLSQTDLVINPKESKPVTLTIATPKNIPFGGYYGILFFQPVLQNATQTTQVIPRVGILLLADIGVPDPNAPQANILTFTTGLLHEDTTIPLLLRVKNISLHFFTAKPILTISPLLSFHHQEVSPTYLEDKLIFQGKVRRWEQTITLPDTQPNIYKVHLAVSTGNDKYVVQDKYIVVFPFTKAIFVLLGLIILTFFITKRKRLKKAFTALFRKE